jgi:bacterioferritin-associated ferredoxin
MDIQQVVSLLLVAAAAAYLGRSGVRAWRAMVSKQGGCASGCGRCAFAIRQAAERTSSRAARSRSVITLTAITPVSRKEKK